MVARSRKRARGKVLLITGAGGYIGSEMVKYFLKEGYAVKALDRFFFGEDVLVSSRENPALEVIKEDVRYCSGEIFKGVDAVIDLAGLSNDPAAELDPTLTKKINRDGPIRIAKLAKQAGVARYLFASSCSVYGHGTGALLSEESALAPVSLYAKAKIEAEHELLTMADKKFTVTLFRNATCYGLSSRMRFDLAVNLMTLHAHKLGRILVMGGGQQWRPFVHVFDIARAYHVALEAPARLIQGEVFNVGSEEQNYQIEKLAHMVKSHLPHTSIEFAPDDPDRRDYRVSFKKIRRVLKFKPLKTVGDGIREIAQALSEQRVTDDIKTITVKYYKHLIDADAVLRAVKYKGKLL